MMNKRLVSLFLCLIIVLGTLCSCGTDAGGVSSAPDTSSVQSKTESAVSSEPAEQKSNIVLALLGNDVLVHTELQELYVSGKSGDALATARGVADLDTPDGVTLTWEDKTGKKADKYIIKISESKDMANAASYEAKTAQYKIYNLKIATEYFWQVTGVYGASEEKSEIISFKTEARAPRNLRVPGVVNVRDLGGWKTADGGTVKQGLLYRCGKLNDHNTGKILITSEGKTEMLATLGIKTEMDLRRENQTGGLKASVLGKGVNYYHCPMESTGVNILTYNSSAVVQAFKVLGDEKNYPIAFHCSIGTDRTGVIAFLVLNLLGVSKADIYSDYMFSNFANIGSSRNHATPKNYFSIMDSQDGKDLAEKTYNYLLSIGCEKSDLDNVIRILKQK